MTLTNRSKSKSIWVALSTTQLGASMTSLTDPNSNQFGNSTPAGISYAQIHVQSTYDGSMQEYFSPAMEIKPGDSSDATIEFSSGEGRAASPGICNLQLQFLLGDDYVSESAKRASTPNLVTKFEAK